MKRKLIIEQSDAKPMERQAIEFVERKGLGHPDTMADGLAEAVSASLSKMYLSIFDKMLHHNTDEAIIVGGQSAPMFGGGAVLEPAYILLVGRATTGKLINGEMRLF